MEKGRIEFSISYLEPGGNYNVCLHKLKLLIFKDHLKNNSRRLIISGTGGKFCTKWQCSIIFLHQLKLRIF